MFYNETDLDCLPGQATSQVEGDMQQILSLAGK